MNASRLVSTLTALAGMLILSGWAHSAVQDRQSALNVLQHSIQSRLDRMDRDLSRAAKELSRTGLSGDQTRVVLARLCSRYPDVVDSCTVDMKGRMIAVEPRTHRNFEGSDISGQEQIIRLHRTQRPVLSQAFRAVEGFDAVDLEWPVFSSGSEMIGSVSLLMRPEELLAGIIRPKTRGAPVKVRVIQTDGRILYADEAKEIGRNLLRDPVLPQSSPLRSAGRQIVTARSGSGAVASPGPARETGGDGQWSWVTVGLHGTEWRVIALVGGPVQDRNW